MEGQKEIKMDWFIYREFPIDLQKEWDELLDESITQVPFLRFEYMKIWWLNRGGGEWKDAKLALTVARRDSRLVGIAPLFISKDRTGNPVLMLLGSIEISDYLDLIVRPLDLEVFIEGLLDFIHQPDFPIWRSLEWDNILEPSPTLEVFRQSAEKKGHSVEVTHLQHAPYIPLPGDFDEYLAGIDKKQRHEIRRKMRRAEESENKVDWYESRDAGLLDKDIEKFLELMKFDPQKKGFLSKEMEDQFRQTIRWAFKADILHLVFLEIDGEKAAGHFSFDYQGRLWAYNSGFSPKYNDLSPGWVLLGLELRWANERGYQEYDFMRGNEEYKYRFGALDRNIVRLTMAKKSTI